MLCRQRGVKPPTCVRARVCLCACMTQIRGSGEGVCGMTKHEKDNDTSTFSSVLVQKKEARIEIKVSRC